VEPHTNLRACSSTRWLFLRTISVGFGLAPGHAQPTRESRRSVLFAPPGFCRLLGDLFPLPRGHAGGARLPTHPAERDRSSVLAVVRAHALDLAGRDPHDVDGIADHVSAIAPRFLTISDSPYARARAVLTA
jgi:hypothetical protein